MKIEKEDICDPKDFEDSFFKYSEELFKFLYYKYRNEALAKDTVQSAFEKLWNNCKKVSYDKVWGFLYTVANNSILNTIKREKNFPTNELSFLTRQVEIESPQYKAEEKEYMDRINKALDELSEAQREAFLLNRVEGMRHKEIAEKLGISQKAVEKRIYGALKQLREKLNF